MYRLDCIFIYARQLVPSDVNKREFSQRSLGGMGKHRNKLCVTWLVARRHIQTIGNSPRDARGIW